MIEPMVMSPQDAQPQLVLSEIQRVVPPAMSSDLTTTVTDNGGKRSAMSVCVFVLLAPDSLLDLTLMAGRG